MASVVERTHGWYPVKAAASGVIAARIIITAVDHVWVWLDRGISKVFFAHLLDFKRRQNLDVPHTVYEFPEFRQPTLDHGFKKLEYGKLPNESYSLNFELITK